MVGRWDLADEHGRPIPHLHGHSETVLPRPSDWPPEWQVTGYWRIAPPPEWAPDPALASFLDAGPPPVYVGFGSMVHKGDRAALTRQLVTPLLDRGERVLLVRGWALSDAGRPQLCCPFAMDQPFWGRRAEALGVAPPSLPLSRFSTGAWKARLDVLLGDERHADAARAVARRLATEDGVARAVEAVGRLAPRHLPTRLARG